MRIERGTSAVLAAPVLIAALFTACARPEWPPQVQIGATCASCGMSVASLRFACERSFGSGFRFYDSIECLMRDQQALPGGHAWLSDYDGQRVHDADSMWVVHGPFPTPMGGGYAAFLDRAAADDLARTAGGGVNRFAAFADSAEARP